MLKTTTTNNANRLPVIPPVILRRSNSNSHVLKSVPVQKVVTAIASSSSSSTTTAMSQTTKNAANRNVIDLTDEDESNKKQTSVMKSNCQPPALVAIPHKVINNKQVLVLNNQTPALPQFPNRVTFKKVAGSNNHYGVTSRTPSYEIRRPSPPSAAIVARHPAPLPSTTNQISNINWKRVPPRPVISIGNIEAGIVISWTMDDITEYHAMVVSYQIYAYQETQALPHTDTWRHVGDVKAMLLPMAVTLTQFQEGQRYHFAVRAVDEHSRVGIFSIPKTW